MARQLALMFKEQTHHQIARQDIGQRVRAQVPGKRTQEQHPKERQHHPGQDQIAPAPAPVGQFYQEKVKPLGMERLGRVAQRNAPNIRRTPTALPSLSRLEWESNALPVRPSSSLMVIF